MAQKVLLLDEMQEEILRHVRVDQVILLGSFRAGGKNALADIIMTAMNNNGIFRWIDVSDAIRHFLARPQTPLGQELQKHKPTMDAGGVIPEGKLIFTLCFAYAWHLSRVNDAKPTRFIFTGAGRNVTETEEHVKLIGDGLDIGHVHGDKPDMFLGVARRQIATGKIRNDETPIALWNAWEDYGRRVIPGLTCVPEAQYHPIPYGQSVRKKVKLCIESFKFPANVRSKLLRRIDSKTHPAYKKIEMLDNDPNFAHHRELAARLAAADEELGNQMHQRETAVPSQIMHREATSACAAAFA